MGEVEEEEEDEDEDEDEDEEVEVKGEVEEGLGEVKKMCKRWLTIVRSDFLNSSIILKDNKINMSKYVAANKSNITRSFKQWLYCPKNVSYSTLPPP